MPRLTVAQDIDIAPYDPGWLVAAEVLRRLFEGALSDLAASIEHVGSTAVPGLAAKPILDVDVILRADSDFPAATTRLAGLGYIHEGDLGVLGREAFKGPSGTTPHHLYVCLPSGREHRRHLAFLDYLRNHPAETAGYAALKRRLAAAFPEDGPRMPRGRALSWKRFWSRLDDGLSARSGERCDELHGCQLAPPVGQGVRILDVVVLVVVDSNL